MDLRFLIVSLLTVACLSSVWSQADGNVPLESDSALEPYDELESSYDVNDNEEAGMEAEEEDIDDEVARSFSSSYDANNNDEDEMEAEEGDIDDEVARGFSWGSTSRQLTSLRKDVNSLKATQRQLKAAIARCRCGNPPPRCPTGYTRYQPRGRFKFCYKAHTSCKGWTSARATCKAEGGDLIVLRDSNDLNFFKTIGKRLFKTGSTTCGHFGFWIGASDQTSEGKFAWVNGRAAKFDKYWGKGQPDNLGNEDCVHVWAAQGYTLNDAYCNGRSGHVAGFFCSRRKL